MDLWRRYRNDSNIHPDLKQKISSFREACASLMRTQYPEQLAELQKEETAEEELRELVQQRRRPCRFANTMPLHLMQEFEPIQKSFVCSSRFPITHYHTVAPEFATRIGFSSARLLAAPLVSFGVNTKDVDEVTNQLASNSQSKPTIATLFYRTVTREVLCVHWEISSSALDNMHISRGIDLTNEIEASRLRQTVSIQKMLRQWLHSIRNASFEQQATIILEEVKALQDKVATSDFDAEFRSIRDCIKLLMHTAKTSVGLIDQALDARGFSQHMCAGDFVNNIISFPHHFAQSEGLAAIYTKFDFVLNGAPAQPQDFLGMFVSGEVVSIQSVVDNVISNAVRYVDDDRSMCGHVMSLFVCRYTDPVRGIEVHLSADQHDDKLNFLLKVTDFAEGGLPVTAVRFLQEGLGMSKCQRVGGVDSAPTQPVHKGRSSRTGLPHIVEMYHLLTESGSDDFDIKVTTSAQGTTYRIRFAMVLMAPMSVTTTPEHKSTPITGEWFQRHLVP